MSSRRLSRSHTTAVNNVNKSKTPVPSPASAHRRLSLQPQPSTTRPLIRGRLSPQPSTGTPPAQSTQPTTVKIMVLGAGKVTVNSEEVRLTQLN
jgi:hypothetical protein